MSTFHERRNNPGIPEGDAVRPLFRIEGLKCKQCGRSTFERLPREGFWQRTIMPFFDRYPWRCTACGKTLYRKSRSGSSPSR